ncbi:hypothetical protein L596_018202 [Steinernema carpocapsae]|uniref:Myosin motor domain-containing protein n=1 Tax=Steinernema carpocapsae TaxID=34508 RepID=A0A4V6A1Y7_STECR|nr:hypothetical protein L596_018202 [Steinernema carpocapsae]
MDSSVDEACQLVWAPHPQHGFVIGKIVDIGPNNRIIIHPIEDETAEPIYTTFDFSYPAEEDLEKDVDDNCSLMYLNEGTLLNNCRIRYAKNQIYTYVANILISINPYEIIPDLYSDATIKAYQGKSIGSMPPHIFAIADKAYRDMRRLSQSQSIIVSGESGAGKTESQKCILRYLCENWGTSAGNIETNILESNPILEAFGNAKTLRNNNSSRFGKFVEIHFGSNNNVAGGFVSHYLLEKSRLCHQQAGERNYHVFYQLIAGSDEDTRSRLDLKSPDKFQYLKHGCTQFFSSADSFAQIPASAIAPRSNGFLEDSMLNDFEDFQALSKALLDNGISDDEISKIFDTVAALLHLGNIKFVENTEDMRGGSMVDPETEDSLAIASKLLGLGDFELRNGLLSRMMQTRGGPKGTMIMVPLKIHEATAARDALAKAIYSRLFDHIVASINKSIPFGDSKAYIGVLDIAGFEFFAVNSFEQFCINYCNEKLQHFFNDRILKQEQELYADEHLGVPEIPYTDNQDCIDLIEMRPNGLLDLLDEEMKLPRSSSQHYTSSVHQLYPNHFRLAPPRKSKLRENRELRDDEGFMVRHYAGSVCYRTALFLEKNNDALHQSLEFVVEQSDSALIQQLFKKETSASSGTAPTRGKGTNKLSVASVGSKFRAQLGLLLNKLETTGTHFVRCIKPNADMKPGQFEGSPILSQLKCAGMTSVLRLMQKGFPSRTMFADLCNMYKSLLPSELSELDPRLFSKCLFHALGLNDDDYKFGITKVFFRPGKFSEFDQLVRQEPDNVKELVGKVKSWLYCVRWRKITRGACVVIRLKNKMLHKKQCVERIQSRLRGYITRCRQVPRIAAFRRANALAQQSQTLIQAAQKMDEASRPHWVERVASLNCDVQRMIATIKIVHTLPKTELKSLVDEMEARIKETITGISEQIDADEQRKINEMEERLRCEQHRAEEEERERQEQERLRQERRMLEEKRLKEEEEFRKQQAEWEEVERKAQEERRQQIAQMEKERLDEELAKRIAVDDKKKLVSSDVSDGAPPFKKSKMAIVSVNGIDLSNWSYHLIREAMNDPSTEESLKEACKAEFHRRLHAYKGWTSHNKNHKKGAAKDERKIFKNPPMVPFKPKVAEPSEAKEGAPALEDRYFKVSYANGQGVGYWFGHFAGQFLSRQLEIPPKGSMIRMKADKDYDKMENILLEESGLTRRKGAEILETEFNLVWDGKRSP